ncbi:hypothetical protein F0562_034917 [Nyssa sinensis]|uniref:Uncharacterized protein n=1 Tax=Nyssa sinensis TaxID=561372 RepID=A0A5J5ABD4_9ASTE|nr:hypothetical protein F0562_034917 [Nyssa sinensis]
MSSVHMLFCLIFIIIVCSVGLHSGSSNKSLHSACGDYNQTRSITIEPGHAYLSHRKLLLHGTCTNRDISVSQSRESSSGIPEYIVQIVNTCVSGCAPSNIHLRCGWFASVRIVNPRSFRRLSYDDCLVNGGKPLKASQIIRFTYSNSFMYPLAFKSAKFC